jgi:hypothetical protein
MKKLLLLSSTLFSFYVVAQSGIQLKQVTNSGTITLVPNATITSVTIPNANTKVTLDVKNTSASTQSYIVKRYDVLLNSTPSATAVAYFCFAGSCYGDVIFQSPSPLVLRSNKSASDTTASFFMLVGDLDEADVVGPSIVKYTFKNMNNANDTAQVTIKYNGSVGVNELNNTVNSFDVFPNPARVQTVLKINALKDFNTNLSIYNALGVQLSEKQIQLNSGKNTIPLSLEGLSAGIYFVTIRSEKRAITKRIVVE